MGTPKGQNLFQLADRLFTPLRVLMAVARNSNSSRHKPVENITENEIPTHPVMMYYHYPVAEEEQRRMDDRHQNQNRQKPQWRPLFVGVVMVLLLSMTIYVVVGRGLLPGGLKTKKVREFLDDTPSEMQIGVTPAIHTYTDKEKFERMKRHHKRIQSVHKRVADLRNDTDSVVRNQANGIYFKNQKGQWRRKFTVPEKSRQSDDDLAMELPTKQLSIVPNQGMGDCLFLCFQEALRHLGVNWSVHGLRQVVADSVDEYKLEFLSAIYKSALKEKDTDILRDYSFMAGVNSLEDLRKVITSRKYYGDEMAVAALDDKFNIKSVVLRMTEDQSKIDLYQSRFSHEQEGEKKRYIILLLDEYNTHYELVEYNNRVIMSFKQLPTTIKLLLGA
jgi:hypothetical protein